MRLYAGDWGGAGSVPRSTKAKKNFRASLAHKVVVPHYSPSVRLGGPGGGGGGGGGGLQPETYDPLCDIPSGCCSFTGPWTVTRSSLRMLRRVAAFCRPLRPVLLLVSFPRSRSPVVGVLGLCWMRHGVPFACQRRPIVGVLRMCWLLPGSFDCFCCPHTSVHRPSIPPQIRGNFSPNWANESGGMI